jgi:hypothetical protein
VSRCMQAIYRFCHATATRCQRASVRAREKWTRDVVDLRRQIIGCGLAVGRLGGELNLTERVPHIEVSWCKVPAFRACINERRLSILNLTSEETD